MKKLLIFFSILFLLQSCNSKDSNTESSQDLSKKVAIIDNELCLYGCPISPREDNLIVDHKIFILSSNRETKFADWVAYKEKTENYNGKSSSRSWKQDPDIIKQLTLIPSDYKDANAKCGYDRGHQAPLASFKIPDGFQTNYLSNITPQKAELNQGAWARLENKIRDLAKKRNEEIYVLTGTYYTDKEMCSLPVNRINAKVPNGYWKIIAIKTHDKISMVSFLLPQETPRNDNYCNYKASLEDIEQISKINIFPANDNFKYDSLEKELGC